MQEDDHQTGSTTQQPRRNRSLRKSMKAVCAILLLFMQSFGLLAAQVQEASAETPQAQEVNFNIPMQPIGSALNAFAEATGWEVSFPTELATNRTSPGLNGRYTPEAALQALLADTGLGYRLADTNAVTLVEESNRNDSSTSNSLNSFSSMESSPKLSTASTNTQKKLAPIQAKPVIVTGELQQRTLQETQTSVTVVKGDVLDRTPQFRDVKDIFNQTANISNVQSGLGLSIRGISAVGQGGAAVGLLANINVDGASYATSAGFRTGALSVWDLGQVEILRGPQSTQRGRNALAGAVLIRSQDPTFDQELKVRGDYGRFNEYRAALAVNFPILEDTLAVRLSGEQFYTDGYIRNPVLDDDEFAANNMQTLRGKVRWQPNESLEVILGQTYSNNLLGTPNVRDDLTGDSRVSLNDGPTAEDGKNYITNLRVNLDLDPRWSVFSESTYYRGDYEIFVGGISTNGGRTIDDTNLTQELRLHYQGEQVSGVIGAYYSDIESDLDFAATFPGALFGPMFAGSTAVSANGTFSDIQNYAIFGEIELNLGRIANLLSNWTVIVGGRFDYEEQKVKGFSSTSLNPGPTFSSTTFQTDTNYSAFLPKGSIIYHWTDEISTGFTVQRGYRAGGAGAGFSTAQFEFDPEFTTNYELAFRSTWFNKRLVANANAFYTKWTDQQVGILGPGGPLDFRTVNAGESELYGFELETQWQVTNNLNVFANLGHSFTRFLDFVTDGEQLRGNEFPVSPRWTGAIGGAYHFDNGFMIEGNGNYTDSVFENATNLSDDESDSYFIVNGRVGYETDHWALYVFARNLLDKRYFIRRRTGINQDGLGEPFIIGVSLQGQFDGFGNIANIGNLGW